MCTKSPCPSAVWLILILINLFNFSGLSQDGPKISESKKLDSLNSIHLNRMEFQRFDKDKDKLISRKEFDDLTLASRLVNSNQTEKNPEDRFSMMDSNADSFISLPEFKFNLVRDTISWPGHSYRNVAYKKVGDKLLLMDILMPTNSIHNKAPVLYFVHGGGFRSGAKEYLRLNDLRAETALYFAEKGYCCVSLSYRLVNTDPGSPIVLIRDCVTDAWDGLRFLKKNADKYQIDPDKIIVWGESAGAHIAQMLTFSDPEKFLGDPALANINVKPAAGISWYGPSDFTGSVVHDEQNSPKNRHLADITGKNSYSDDDFEALREVSPYFLVTKDSPPLLLMQGDSDQSVHLSHATLLNSKAQKLEAKVELIVVKNAGHNWRQVGEPIEPSKTQIRSIMFDFAESTQ